MSQTIVPTRPKLKPRPAGNATIPTSNAGANSVLLELPILRTFAAKLGVQELRRRLVHMSPAVLPFFLWVIPHQDPWGPLLINSVLAISVAMIALALVRFGSIARSQQEQGLGAIIGYAFPVLMMVLLLPDRGELAVMTLAIMALGDGSATFGGLWFGGRRLPWNNRKTFAGLLSFCVCGTFFATVIYLGEARPAISWQTALTITSISTIMAAIVESLPLPWNDNLRVGMTAAMIGSFVQIVWLGR